MRADRIARFLPETYRAAYEAPDSLLKVVLGVMETMQKPGEDILDGLDSYLDPVRTPDRFVPMLAGWLDLAQYLEENPSPQRGLVQHHFAPGLNQLRLLITRATDLNKRRGTRVALQDFLKLATGIAGFHVEENPPDGQGNTRPFHIRVHAPDAARVYHGLITRIVDRERPAYVTYEIAYPSGTVPEDVITEKEESHAEL